MRRLLAIDPGNSSGLALFEFEGQWVLKGAWVTSPDVVVFVPPLEVIVIECPKMYPHEKNPGSILKLALTVGRYVERYPGRQFLPNPRDWKGTIDGDIMTARIEAEMNAREREIYDKIARGTRHNAADAIGIGKWALRQPWMRVGEVK